MPYTALPDRRIPYDNDGTIVYKTYQWMYSGFVYGPGAAVESNATLAALNSTGTGAWSYQGVQCWMFFPEQREITAISGRVSSGSGGWTGQFEGSNNTTNGMDGTWEVASLPAGTIGQWSGSPDAFRNVIKPVSFTGGKRTIRMGWVTNEFHSPVDIGQLHLYGEKVAGQTPDDIIYIDHDTTPGVEYTADEDFGDRPLGTTVTRQFRLKNVSASKTANGINIQCNDTDFAISTDNVTWVVTISIASLGPGAESATMYIRNTTPAPGGQLGPRFARIVTTVASYT